MRAARGETVLHLTSGALLTGQLLEAVEQASGQVVPVVPTEEAPDPPEMQVMALHGEAVEEALVSTMVPEFGDTRVGMVTQEQFLSATQFPQLLRHRPLTR
jgi:hypothetical protein